MFLEKHIKSRSSRFLATLAASSVVLFAADPASTVRVTGTIAAVRSVELHVPITEGQGGNLTLVKLIRNGSRVHPGDLLAEFDDTNEIKLAREAQAKYDDLSHQVEQKQAEHKSNAEKRASDLQQAQADLQKAEIDIRKGPILSEIEQQKNEVKLADAKDHVASLGRSNHSHDIAEAAEIRILELQRDRQKIGVQRAQRNAERLSLRAPIQGMIALQNSFRNGSFDHAEEGDQLWPGSPLLRLFDPSAMEVELSVGEPDGAALKPGTKAIVHLDAFPGLTFTAHYDSASPVASGGEDSPIKTFSARFTIDQTDPHLLPDLSAAVDLQLSK